MLALLINLLTGVFVFLAVAVGLIKLAVVLKVPLNPYTAILMTFIALTCSGLFVAL